MISNALKTAHVNFNDSEIDLFISKSVKRDTPIAVTLDRLFYNDENENSLVYFSCFEAYYEETTDEMRRNIKHLFHCLNANVLLTTKSAEEYIRIIIPKHRDLKEWHFDLPMHFEMLDFITDYVTNEISCDISFEEIRDYLRI